MNLFLKQQCFLKGLGQKHDIMNRMSCFYEHKAMCTHVGLRALRPEALMFFLSIEHSLLNSIQ